MEIKLQKPMDKGTMSLIIFLLFLNKFVLLQKAHITNNNKGFGVCRFNLKE